MTAKATVTVTAEGSNQVVRPKFIDKVEVNHLYARDFQYINTFDNVVGMEQSKKTKTSNLEQ